MRHFSGFCVQGLTIGFLISACRIDHPPTDSRRKAVYDLPDGLALKDIRFAGDMNADTFGDLAILVYDPTDQKTTMGLVSGRTQEIIAEADDSVVFDGDQSLKSLRAPGDLNRDGYDDISLFGEVFTGGPSRESGLFSTDASEPDEEANGPVVGDMNLDGNLDTLFSDIVWSKDASDEIAPTTNVLYSVDWSGKKIFAQDFDLGVVHSAAQIGDSNGDGSADVAILAAAANGKDSWTLTLTCLNGGKSAMRNSKAGDILFAKEIDLAMDSPKGIPSLISAGDLSGDDIGDFFVIEHLTKTEDKSLTSRFAAFSGVDGSTIFSASGNSGEMFAESAGGGSDFNGDGVLDLLVTARNAHDATGRNGNDIQIRSGNNGDLIDHFFFSRDVLLGARATFGDIDGDGLGDMIIANSESFFTVIYGSR